MRWIALAAATAAVAVGLDAVAVPSPTLFGALLVGLAAALLFPPVPAVSPALFRGAQAMVGVTLGVYVQGDSLKAVAGSWLPVLFVSAATLGLSLLCGHLLARITGVDKPTAALGMIAGGASGIVGMSGELGADDRLVAFMQYLRVLVVVTLTPIFVAIGFQHTGAGGAGPGGGPVLGTLGGWGIAAGAIAGGLLLVRAADITAGTLLGPMLVAAAITLVTGGHDQIPPILREPAFGAIGLQVGLRFTVEAVRQAGRLALPTLLMIVGLMVASFGLALVLTWTTDSSLLTSYLATTPGGLFAVLAAAFGTGADTTFVVAVQTLRLFAMVLLAPVAVRMLVR